jgi:hypothetical protein
MGLGARIVERKGRTPHIGWRWDPETDILTGAVKRTAATAAKDAPGLNGSVELEGTDGSFVLLDVVAGKIRGVEVVVWPDVCTVAGLTPPAEPAPGDVELPARRSQPAVAAVEVDATLAIDANADESVFHVRVGPSRHVAAVRVADGLVVEVDEGAGELAGLWLTGVPPFPVAADDTA